LRHSSRRRVRNSTSTPDFGAFGRISAKFAQCLHSSANCARRTGGSMFAAVNTVEPPILELGTARLLDGDKT
jgi:hypothetical protein